MPWAVAPAEERWPVDVDLRTDDLGPQVREWIVCVVRHVLTGENAQAGCVSVVIGNDSLLHELNREYRSIDAPTDVLAFAMTEGEGFPTSEAGAPALGDVIISWPRACAQALERGAEPHEELTLLLVHGCLHLLGYDHATGPEQTAMWARQEAIVQRLLVSNEEAGRS